jgi:hypothetical protein
VILYRLACKYVTVPSLVLILTRPNIRVKITLSVVMVLKTLFKSAIVWLDTCDMRNRVSKQQQLYPLAQFPVHYSIIGCLTENRSAVCGPPIALQLTLVHSHFTCWPSHICLCVLLVGRTLSRADEQNLLKISVLKNYANICRNLPNVVKVKYFA